MTAIEQFNKEERIFQFKTDKTLSYLRGKLIDVYNYAELLCYKEIDGCFTPIYSEKTNLAIKYWERQMEFYISQNYPEFKSNVETL